MNAAISQLRVNVKSLSAEASIIREEIRKVIRRSAHKENCWTEAMEVIDSLQHHRVCRLKPEARLAHLALAFVKGVPYKKVEPTTNNPPSADTLFQKLRRFTPVSMEDVNSWLTA